MDLLQSGPERAPLQPGRLLRWRPPRRVTGLLAVAALLVALAGAVAAPGVRRASRELRLSVAATSVVAVREPAREGVLLLEVRNRGRQPVVLDRVELDVAGVRAAPAAVDRRVPAGGTVQAEVAFAVGSCASRSLTGSLRLVPRQGRPVRVPVLPDDDGLGGPAAPPALSPGHGAAVPVAVDVLGACGGPRADVVALGLRTAGGTRRVDGDAVRGRLLVDVAQLSGVSELVTVRAEVVGALFSAAVVRPLVAGQQAELSLPFDLPSCGRLQPAGRVVVTSVSTLGGRRELAFAAQGAGRAVDLGLVLGACRDGVPVP